LTLRSGNSFKIWQGQILSGVLYVKIIIRLGGTIYWLDQSIKEIKMAKVFFGAGDAYRVLGNSTTTYGVAGGPADSVLIESSARGVSVNGNVDRVDFAGSMADFRFRAGFGANMSVFAADGTTLLVTIALQSDVDGTQLVFADGGVDAIYNAGILGVGGVTITGTAGAITPAASEIDTTVTTQAGVAAHTPLSSKIFLESGDMYREINDGATVYGVAGDSTDCVIIESGARGVSFNANLDRIDFTGSLTDFTFRSGFGANMEVYAADGTTLLAKIPLQTDADGTQLVFSNGGVDAVYSAGAIGVGGVALTGTARTISPAASEINTDITTGNRATTITVSAADNGNTYEALSTIKETFNIGNNASYHYSISGFELGVDVINIPSGTTIDNTAMDGNASLEWASGGVVVGVTLVGLTDAQDSQLTTLAGWGNSLVLNSGNGSTDSVSADIGSVLGSSETLNASGKGFIFTDNANIQNSVIITGFSTDDVINVSNAVDGDYSFSNDGEYAYIIYNNLDASIVNEILLAGVTSDELIYDEASFEAVMGFGAFSFV